MPEVNLTDSVPVKMRAALDNIHGLYTDAQRRPVETAVWWIEYVCRHKGAKILQPKLDVENTPWHQYHHVDILVFFSVIALGICCALILSCVLCCKTCCRNKFNDGKRQNTPYDMFVQTCWAHHKRQYPDELIDKEMEEFNKQCSVWWYNLPEWERVPFQEMDDRQGWISGPKSGFWTVAVGSFTILLTSMLMVGVVQYMEFYR